MHSLTWVIHTNCSSMGRGPGWHRKHMSCEGSELLLPCSRSREGITQSGHEQCQFLLQKRGSFQVEHEKMSWLCHKNGSYSVPCNEMHKPWALTTFPVNMLQKPHAGITGHSCCGALLPLDIVQHAHSLLFGTNYSSELNKQMNCAPQSCSKANM